MRLREVGELPLLDFIRSKFPGKPGAVLTGIGDDAAVLKADGKKLLATTDMMVEGVHFDLGFTTPYQLGFKLVSVNVSDIYAMGGTPRFALLAMAAPGATDKAFVQRLLEGAGAALKRYRAHLVGGDLSSSRKGLTLSLTLLGYAEKPVLRSGARPGDRIYVTGGLGASACGLRLLKRINRPVDLSRPMNRPLKWKVMEPLLRRHLMPEARKPGAFVKSATAMIDLSDGLFIDLSRLCAESGVGARLHAGKIPVPPEVGAAAEFLGLDPFRLATAGGEDYEMLFTTPSDRSARAIHIGEITRSRDIWLMGEDGSRVPVTPEGYRHFA